MDFILHRDFIENRSKFYAVLSAKPLLCSLRYIRSDGTLRKVDEEIVVSGIEDVGDAKIFSGKERLKEIIEHPDDVFEQDVRDLANFLSSFVDAENMGISGSGLIKCYRNDSDIDFVIYGMENFNRARNEIKSSILNGGLIKNLNSEQWKELFAKRIFRNELTYDEFLWHEKRKFNKGTINNRKFDLLLSDNFSINLNFKKIKKVEKTGKVVNANPFSYPAYYEIVEAENVDVESKNKNTQKPNTIKILCFTHTYVGQAFEGEKIAVSGMLEEINNGTNNETDNNRFVIVGTSRKAVGEYIKVVE